MSSHQPNSLSGAVKPNTNAVLPRVIHHTWKRAKLGATLKHCVDSFRKLNPNWECRFYNDEDCEAFVQVHFPDFYPDYLKYPPGILRADIFRVLVLYHTGGVYADVDVECLSPLDDLIASVPEDHWELLITVDHPVHHQMHYAGRVMWMNDFMIAMPRSRFLGQVIERFKAAAHAFHSPAEAVFITGPGLFTQLVEEAGGPEAASVTPLPWQWVHPLPDMALDFPGKEEVEKTIKDGTWRAHGPFVVHYWHHTWSTRPNTLALYQNWLLQTDGAIVEERLQAFVPSLGEKADTVGRAIAEFAEANFETLIDVSRSPDAKRGGPGRGSLQPWNGFQDVAQKVLVGLSRKYVAIQIEDPEQAGSFFRTWDDAAGLIYLGYGTGSEADAQALAEHARIIIERNLLKPGGMILIDGHATVEGGVSNTKYLNPFLREAGFVIAEVGEQLLLQKVDFAIPRVIHVIDCGLDGAPRPSLTNRWLEAHEEKGWRIQPWRREDLFAFLAEIYPEGCDMVQKWKEYRSQTRMASLFVLRAFGGVVIEETFTTSLDLDELLKTHRLLFLTGSSRDSAGRTRNPAFEFGLIASTEQHPFWATLEDEPCFTGRANRGESHEMHALAARIERSTHLLVARDRPVVMQTESITPSSEVPLMVLVEREEPTPAFVSSRLCQQKDFIELWFQAAAAELGQSLRFHRKLWEYCFLWQALLGRQLLRPGTRILAFATDADPIIPALLCRGCEVVIVDLAPPERPSADLWIRRLVSRYTKQLSSTRAPELIQYLTLPFAWSDPILTSGFDAVYSSDFLNRFAEFDALKAFVTSATGTLRPGGAAFFSCDFDLSSAKSQSFGGGRATLRGCVNAANLRQLETELAAEGLTLQCDLTLGDGDVESFIEFPPYKEGPHLRAFVDDGVKTSVGLILQPARREPGHPSRPVDQKKEHRGYLTVGGSLSEVARTFYLSNTYELLERLTTPTSIVCYSPVSGVLDFFRYHPNSQNLVLLDVAHLYLALQRDQTLEHQEIERRICEACGLSDTRYLAHRREPSPLGAFAAPDSLPNETGHIVIHPFGREWGDFPAETQTILRRALALVPADQNIYVLGKDDRAADSRLKIEDFPCDLPNVRVLTNLSAPAAFSLTASASRFIGTHSSLAQVAAFEKVPSLILHPQRCSDYQQPCSDYARTILRANGLALAFDQIPETVLEQVLIEFLKNPHRPLFMPTDFQSYLS